MTFTSQMLELPDAEFLHDRFRYDDGCLFWKARPASDFVTTRAAAVCNANWAGKRAGSVMKNGYRVVSIDGVKYLEHRLIYRMMVGPIDAGQRIDHKDGNCENNRYQNLRACSHAENLMNQPGRRDGMLPKHVGWSKREQKYKVSMRANGKFLNLGTYGTLSEAAEAADRYRRKFHGEFADHRASRCRR